MVLSPPGLRYRGSPAGIPAYLAKKPVFKLIWDLFRIDQHRLENTLVYIVDL